MFGEACFGEVAFAEPLLLAQPIPPVPAAGAGGMPSRAGYDERLVDDEEVLVVLATIV